ncbi:DUF1937 family protein [Roseinatronobacter sp.]
MSAVQDLWQCAWDSRGGGLTYWGARPDSISRLCQGRLVYLASPITRRLEVGSEHPDWLMVERIIMECAIDLDALAGAGVCAVSPVLQALEMIRGRGGKLLDGPRAARDAAFWRKWCAPLLVGSAAVVVPDRPGWAQSEGIAAEVDFALSRNRLVFIYADRPCQWRAS